MATGRKYPKVLLIGNGINRAFGGAGWSALLKALHTNPKIPFEKIKDLPFPLQAVLATEDQVDTAMLKKKEAFYGADHIEELKQPLQALLGAGFDHILTTNYSYELERVAGICKRRDGEDCKKYQDHTRETDRAEQKYLLHTFYRVPYNGVENKVWHIHGEARKKDSIVLGHYYYGNLLGKYQEILRRRGNRQLKRQDAGEPPIIESWLEAFIMGDVYVLGFGFDYSEMDLWWLLNRKKKENADHGTVWYFAPGEDPVKLSLLDAYGVQTEDLGFHVEPEDYKPFYTAAIEKICAEMAE